MIRVDLGEEVSPGIFAYSIPNLGTGGRSRQPLLDACRQIERILGDTKERVALFRPGRTVPDLTCSVTVGADTTVAEPSAGTIHFAKFQKFSGSAITGPNRHQHDDGERALK